MFTYFVQVYLKGKFLSAKVVCIFNLTDIAQLSLQNGYFNLSVHTWFYCENSTELSEEM